MVAAPRTTARFRADDIVMATMRCSYVPFWREKRAFPSPVLGHHPWEAAAKRWEQAIGITQTGSTDP
ncbi:hypothetical protein ILYODFUR_027301 [Ilyodon furcidens]|uniref:Uncharacterized protein n=1 Tax=Ilyodon furcidens TaxID=33524 RepID=A0ABV0T395_9TELE